MFVLVKYLVVLPFSECTDKTVQTGTYWYVPYLQFYGRYISHPRR